MYLKLGEEAEACSIFEFEAKDYPLDLQNITSRFRKLSLKYHPDKNPVVTKSIDVINNAYTQLKQALKCKQLNSDPLQKLYTLKSDATSKIEELKELEHSLEDEKTEMQRLRNELPKFRDELILLDDKLGKLTDPHVEKSYRMKNLMLALDVQKSQTFKTIYTEQTSWMRRIFGRNFVADNQHAVGVRLFENIEKSDDVLVRQTWRQTLAQLQSDHTFVEKQQAFDVLSVEVADLDTKTQALIKEKKAILVKTAEAEQRIEQIQFNAPSIAEIIRNRSLNVSVIAAEIKALETQLIKQVEVTDNKSEEKESKDLPVVEEIGRVAAAFRKIYVILQPSKTKQFGKNFLEEHGELSDEKLLQLACEAQKNKPKSRTACAYRLAKICYSDVSADNNFLVSEVYKFNFGRDVFKKCTLRNKTFFTKKALKKEIGVFTSEDVDALKQKNDNRIGSIIKGLSAS